MSFGWSVGDIVCAVKILYQVGAALRDSDGASSDFQDTISFLEALKITLEHINTLQNIPLDPRLVSNLTEQCSQVRDPVEIFVKDAKETFERALGENSRRSKLLAAPR